MLKPISREYPSIEFDEQKLTLAPITTDRIFDFAELFNIIMREGSQQAQQAIANVGRMGLKAAYDDKTQIVTLITLGASCARTEFKTFMAGLLGLSVADYETLPFDVTVQALLALKDHPDVARFLAVFESLDVNEILETLAPEQATDSSVPTTPSRESTV